MPITDDVKEYKNAEGNVLSDYDDDAENSVNRDTPSLPVAEIIPELVNEVVENTTKYDGNHDEDGPVGDNIMMNNENEEVLGSINITDYGN